MRVLQLHCLYTRPGGEDRSAAAEASLLRSHGHEVLEFNASNAEIMAKGLVTTLRALLASGWNGNTYRRVRQAIREFRPDVVHVQNFWFALSPSVFAAAKAEGVPTVMTLRNFRLICPGALLMRDGRVCEVCLGRSTWRGVPRRCYRGSAIQTALVARMIDSNRHRGTWTRMVDVYIALTEFSRRKFIQGGLPADKLHVKPNFMPEDPGPAAGRGDGAVYVGRLSPEKGVHVLLDAWKLVREGRLTVVGDGPERKKLKLSATSAASIAFVGHIEPRQVMEKIKKAAFLVMPSVWYETFGRTILEAFACGRPVVASRLGAVAELVDDGRTGLLFRPGDARDLAEKIRHLLDNPDERERMGREARAEFEAKYTADRNYHMLMAIYERAVGNRRSRRK